MSTITRKYLSGAGSILELWPSPRPSRVFDLIDPKQTILDALVQDWVKVSADYRAAFDEVTRQIGPVDVEEQ